MGLNPVSKGLIGLGVALIAVGVLWHFFGSSFSRFGRLPGDIAVEKENFKFYFPITTSILLSIALTLVLWIWRKFF